MMMQRKCYFCCSWCKGSISEEVFLSRDCATHPRGLLVVGDEVGRGGDADEMAESKVVLIFTSSVAHRIFCPITQHVICLV